MASQASILPNGKQQYFTTPGVPAVGYKLATFASGTSTPQATWADAAKIGANTNPIILDARGEAVVYWDGVYKVQLQDSTGAVIWTVDPVQSLPILDGSLIPTQDNTFDLGSAAFSWRQLYLGAGDAAAYNATSGNIGYFKQTAAEIAAGVTPTDFSYPPGDVRRYGAVGDGVTDDTTALQNCFKVNQSVNFPGPAFKYLISSTVPYSIAGGVINGNGSTLKISAAWTPVANIMTNISVLNANDVTIQGLLFDSTAYAGAASQNWGIVFQGTAGGVTQRCRALNNHFLNMPAQGSGIAFFTGSSQHIAMGNTFTTCHGGVFSQADHSIQDSNVAFNPSDASFVIQGLGNVGSSITNNKIYNPGGNPANHIGVEEGPSDWQVTGNTIYGLNGTGVYLFNSAITTAVRGGVIANNVIDGGNGTVSAPGQVLQGISTTQYYTHCNIHDNIVKNLPSNVGSSSVLLSLFQTGSVAHHNDLDATSVPSLVCAVSINPAATPDVLDFQDNKLNNTGGNRAIMLTAGAFGSQRICIQGGEIIGGSVGIDANFTANSGADIWIINVKRNTAATPVNVATNYTVLADFQTFFNSVSGFVYPHSMKTLSATVMYGNATPAGTSGVQNSTIFNAVPAVGGRVAWVKTGAATWTASAAIF